MRGATLSGRLTRRLLAMALLVGALFAAGMTATADAEAGTCWVQADGNTGDRTQYCYVDWNWGWTSSSYYEEYRATQYGGAYLQQHTLYKYFYASNGYWVPWFCMAVGSGSARLVSCPF